MSEMQKQNLNDDLNDREDLIEALSIVTQLYTDKAHLVYELLQNAEDCGATQVKFIMYSNRLEFIHDGEPFTQENLTSIRRIGKTTKDSLNTIGKFGVGFKSIFSICKEFILLSTPKNYSLSAKEYLPSFAYRIKDFRYIDEENTVAYTDVEKPFTTKFIFPFCVGERYSGYKTISELYSSLSQRLNKLGSEVLLFLKHVASVEYVVYDIENKVASSGEYLLEKKDMQNGCFLVTALGSSKNKGEESKNYLLYSKPIPVLDNKKSMDIAFAFSDFDEHGKPIFSKLPCPTITVYFPTEKESKLHFIIQGPFATPPHRGDVPDDDNDNKYLVGIATELFAEAMYDLKSRNWITLDFIELLPYGKVENQGWLFKPIQQKLQNILSNDEMLPSVDGVYIKAREAKLADSADLAEIFCFPLLAELLGKQARWLPTVLTDTNPKYRNLYNFFKKEFFEYIKNDDDINYKQETIIKEISIETIGSALRESESFLSNRDDEWLVSFYTYLAEKRPAMLRSGKGSFSTVPFLKTVNNQFAAPYIYDSKTKDYVSNIFIRPSSAIFNLENADIIFANSIVPQSVVKALYLEEPDGYNYFRREIESNENNEQQDDDVNLSQVKKAIKYLKDGQNGAADVFRGLLFLKVIDTNGKTCIAKVPEFRSLSGNIYFTKDKFGCSIKDYFGDVDLDVYMLDEEFYLSNGIRKDDLRLLKLIGVEDNLINLGNDEWDGSYGATCSNHKEFKYFLSIDGIDKVLQHIFFRKTGAEEKSAIIMQLLENVKRNLKGQWRDKKVNPTLHEGVSKIIDLLRRERWVFSNSGEVVKPSEIAKNDLDKSIYQVLDLNSSLFDLLGFKVDASEQITKVVTALKEQFGDSVIDILLKELSKQEDSDFDPTVDGEYKGFPIEPIKDLRRLQEEMTKRFGMARKVEYERVYRRIRTSRGKDKEHIGYRYKGYCQMCENPSRFWEVAEIYDEPKKEVEQMNLSLCPSCASEFRYLRNNPEIMQAFTESIRNASLVEDESIPIGEERCIRFTKAHLAEVQTIIKLMK